MTASTGRDTRAFLASDANASRIAEREREREQSPGGRPLAWPQASGRSWISRQKVSGLAGEASAGENGPPVNVEPPPRMVTVEEAARMAGVRPALLRSRIARGTLPAERGVAASGSG
jgi:hypothetical protein